MEDLKFIKDEKIIEILNKDENLSFKSALIDTMDFLKTRSFLNYEKIVKELNSIRKNSIDIDEYYKVDHDLSMYIRIINDIDGYRSRVSDIFSRAQGDLYSIDKAYDSLYKIWSGRFSKQSSDKKREGEAEYILHFLFEERIKRKDLHDMAKTKYNMLSAKMEAISRKITIAQELLKIVPGGNLEYNSKNHRAEEKTSKISGTNYNARLKEGDGKGWSALTKK